MAFTPNKRNKKTRIDEAPELKFGEFEKRRFVENTLSGDYILVLGGEVIMSERVVDTGNVNDYILNCINVTLREDGSISNDYVSIDEVIKKTKDGIDPVWNLLNNEDFKNSMEESDMCDELKRLLDLKYFPIVITTTFDSYVEKYMQKIWGSALRIVNIFDDNSLSSFRDRLALYPDLGQYHEPTLIYAFGKVERDESKFYARNEDDYMLVIEQWFRKISDKNDLIYNFLTNDRKRLLALGCKFDNWYFRFFWYILRRKEDQLRKGMVALAIDPDDNSDNRLQQYLDHIRVFNHKEARRFMKDVVDMLTIKDSGSLFCDLIKNSRKKRGVFISYCGKDAKTAVRIFEILKRKFDKVWIDNEEIDGGDDYLERIQDGIFSARVFIALLGSNTAEDLKKGITDNVYNTEWKWASERKDEMTIIPVAINGYDLRSDYHHIFEQITNVTVSGISLMEPDGFSKLEAAISKHI